MQNRTFSNANGKNYAILKDYTNDDGRIFALIMDLQSGSRFIIAKGLSYENRTWDQGYYFEEDLQAALNEFYELIDFEDELAIYAQS